MVTSRRNIEVDIVIMGAGIAGLWMLRRLLQAGYRTVLLESDRIGAGQTRYAQGIIHGGTKYALTGTLSEAAKRLATMPTRWRQCLDGEGELDLGSVKILSEFQYLWSTANLGSRMAGFFASKLMRSRTRPLARNETPELFQHADFNGQVYRLDEPVLDVASMLTALVGDKLPNIIKVEPTDLVIETDDSGSRIDLQNLSVQLQAKKLILAAGKGNAELLQQLGARTPAMQLRPLQMVALRGTLPTLFAHCLNTSPKPRITINSSTDSTGSTVWYLGGQLAEEGVGQDAQTQIGRAKKELATLFPWYDFSHCEWMTLNIERAESKQANGQLPDDVFAQQEGSVICTWPSKMVLAPLLADRVEALLHRAAMTPSHDEADLAVQLADLPHAEFAPLPWREEQRWR